jgi:hypothetical protein
LSVKRRLAIVCGATVAATTLMVAPTALAVPRTGSVFSVSCPGVDAFEVVVPGGGPFTPAFFVGTHQLLIPYRVMGTATVGGVVVERFNFVKKAPIPADAIECDFEGQFVVDGQLMMVAGTVVGVLRGAP